MNERKVWVTVMPHDVPAGYEVMIEQFGDKPPNIAIRRDAWATWGPPVASTVAP